MYYAALKRVWVLGFCNLKMLGSICVCEIYMWLQQTLLPAQVLVRNKYKPDVEEVKEMQDQGQITVIKYFMNATIFFSRVSGILDALHSLSSWKGSVRKHIKVDQFTVNWCSNTPFYVKKSDLFWLNSKRNAMLYSHLGNRCWFIKSCRMDMYFS